MFSALLFWVAFFSPFGSKWHKAERISPPACLSPCALRAELRSDRSSFHRRRQCAIPKGTDEPNPKLSQAVSLPGCTRREDDHWVGSPEGNRSVSSHAATLREESEASFPRGLSPLPTTSAFWAENGSFRGQQRRSEFRCAISASEIPPPLCRRGLQAKPLCLFSPESSSPNKPLIPPLINEWKGPRLKFMQSGTGNNPLHPCFSSPL